jgi:hypothetical protein
MPSRLVEDIAPIIEEIVVMFASDEPRRAEIARHLYRTAVDEPAQIEHVYCSLDWCGGSGSMADFNPSNRNINRRYLQLLVELVQAFERSGYHCPRARAWASDFAGWLRSGTV